MQDNGQAIVAYNDLLAILRSLTQIAVVSETVISPQEVSEFPTACLTLGASERTPANLLQSNFSVNATFVIFLHVHATDTKPPIGSESGTTPMILKLIEDVVDAIQLANVSGSIHEHGYSAWASNDGDTDEGTLAFAGIPQACARVEVLVKLPPADKVVV